MRTGEGKTGTARRFAFVCDAHVTEAVHPCMQRILDWVGRQAAEQHVQDLVLGGDLTHQARTGQAAAFLRSLSCPADCGITYIPGNNETTGLSLDTTRHQGLRFVRGLARLENWPGHVYALGASDPREAGVAVRELAKHLPATGRVLILAHFPPEGVDGVAECLARPSPAIEWICGHDHQADDRMQGNLRVHSVCCLDPVKARGTLPELFVGDWDGHVLVMQRIPVPTAVLKGPVGFKHPLGLAFQGTAGELLETALSENCPAVQFQYAREMPRLKPDQVAEFRRRFAPGFLSLHLPDTDPEIPRRKMEALDPSLAWAGEAGLDNLTIHLPKVPVSRLFDQQREFLDTPWARDCLAAYQALAERVIGLKATLSIENLYNHGAVRPEQEQLSSRPWHLVRFVDVLRDRLHAAGYGDSAVRQIGILLDVGHAFRDPVVSREHGLADWLSTVAPYLQACHIHQTRPVDGAMVNHLPINLLGPRINFAGLLPVIGELVPHEVPLLIEVRDRAEAVESLRVLAQYRSV